jgi:spore germination protein YaaH
VREEPARGIGGIPILKRLAVDSPRVGRGNLTPLFPWTWARVLCLVLLSVPLLTVETGFASGLDPASTTPAAARANVPLQRQSTAATSVPRPSREIFGFATAGSIADPSFGYPTWNFDLLSTVAFFAIHVQYNGVMIADSNWSIWDSSVLTGFVNTAHTHGVKVVVTLVGPNNPTEFCDSLYNADTTVAQIVNQVTLKGIDGVNIDYEGQLQQCNPTTPGLVPQSNQALLTNFAKLLRAGLDKARPGYYLSIDTYSASASATDGFFNIPDLTQVVDSFFVMTYDMDVANWGLPPLNCTCLSPVSPLTNYYYNDTTSMAQYSAVAGPGKTILGQPYYGRVACVASPVANAPPTTSVVAVTYLDAISVSSSPDVQPGTFVVHRGDANDPTGLDRWDTWYDLRLGCWREMYWGDDTQLAVRYMLVNQDNLRGVGFWTLNYGGGSAELWDTLDTYFVKCTSASLSPSSGSQPAGSTIALTASSTGCKPPEYAFWVQYPNGTWHLVRGWGGATFNWDTSGLALGNYTIHVWANAIGNSYDAIGSATVTLTPCTSASLSPGSPSQSAGATITFTATSTGCPNPRYTFWVQYPGGNWYLVQNVGSPTFNWNTSGLPLGTYTIHVWVNAVGDGYDAIGSATVTLTPCTSASLSPSTPSQPAGTTLSFTASSTGCPSTRYAFWVEYPNGNWYFLQNFGGPSFNWNTAGLDPGSYTVHVWANFQGNAYDAIGAATATLTGCTSAALAPASGSSAAGSTITFTASAGGCPNPTFEFWLLDPGGTWHFMRDYSTTTTWSWNSAGWAKGAYTIHVWANQQGASLNTYETIGSATYSLT